MSQMPGSDVVAARRSWSGRIASRVAVTEGQLQTMAIGAVLTLLVTVLTIPPLLDPRVVPRPAALDAGPGSPGDESQRAAAPPVDPVEASAGPSALPPLGSLDSDDGVLTPLDAAPDASSPGPPSSSEPASDPRRGLGPLARLDGIGQIRQATTLASGDLVVASDAAGDDPTIVRLDAEGEVRKVLRLRNSGAGESHGVTGIVPAGDNQVFLSIADAGTVISLDLENETVGVVADLPDLPLCVGPLVTSRCESGYQDRPPSPRGLAITGTGDLYIADAGQAAIFLAPRGGGDLTVVASELDLLALDAEEGVTGLAVVESEGALLATVGSPVLSGGAGIVRRYPIKPDGSLGDGATLHTTQLGANPGGVAVSAEVGVVVSLRGQDAVIALADDGSERGRVVDGSLVAPRGIAVVRNAVVVAVESEDPTRTSVLLRIPTVALFGGGG